jgi:hypothetical protein
MRSQELGGRSQEAEGSPDEKIFITMHEKGIFPTPYTPHPTPFFKSGDRRQEV